MAETVIVKAGRKVLYEGPYNCPDDVNALRLAMLELAERGEFCSSITIRETEKEGASNGR
jgi:hypothetical protein